MSTHSPYLKKIQELAVQAVVNDLVDKKEEGCKSRTAQDSYTVKLHCLELMGITIKRDGLCKWVEWQSKKRKQASAEPIQEAAPIEEVATYKNDHDVSSVSCPSYKSDTNEIANEIMDSSKAGRPKGSMHQKKREDIKNYNECVNAITKAYNNELTQCRDRSKTVLLGFLKEVIEQTKVEFSIRLWVCSADLEISNLFWRINFIFINFYDLNENFEFVVQTNHELTNQRISNILYDMSPMKTWFPEIPSPGM